MADKSEPQTEPQGMGIPVLSSKLVLLSKMQEREINREKFPNPQASNSAGETGTRHSSSIARTMFNDALELLSREDWQRWDAAARLSRWKRAGDEPAGL